MTKYKVVLKMVKDGKTITKKVVKRATIDRKACEQFINDQAKQVFAERDDIVDCSFVNGWSLSYHLDKLGVTFYYRLEFIE